jgi:hypothetical protein
MDEALQHISIAYDLLMTTTQAELRSAFKRIATLEAQVAAMNEE